VPVLVKLQEECSPLSLFSYSFLLESTDDTKQGFGLDTVASDNLGLDLLRYTDGRLSMDFFHLLTGIPRRTDHKPVWQ